MKQKLRTIIFCAAVALAAVVPAQASTFTISGSGSSFTIQRSGEGTNAAETDKLYECWLLNCSITAENPGGALSIIGFAVSNDVVSVTVHLVRQSPLGFITGALYLYGADALSVGFGDRPISEEIINFRDGDSIFDTAPATGSVTQTVTATFDTSIVTETFFKAAIEFPIDSRETPRRTMGAGRARPGGVMDDWPQRAQRLVEETGHQAASLEN